MTTREDRGLPAVYKRRGFVRNGRLCCPNGHCSDLCAVEKLTSIREVHATLQGERLLISTTQDDGDPEFDHMHCRVCMTDFDLPDGLDIDYSDEV